MPPTNQVSRVWRGSSWAILSKLCLLILTGISAASLSQALMVLLQLARRAWQYPVIFADSAALIRPGDQWGPALLPWLWSQHNEHRIIVQRLSSLLGEAVLQLPPGAGGVPANVLLLLAISGSLAWICALLIPARLTALACWLVCTLLAWHPQQWENMLWEFQTPWFLISLLVLLNTAIQLQSSRGRPQRRLAQVFAAVAPPLAIFSSGQGFAAAAAITAGALASNRRAGLWALAGTGLAMVIFFGFGYHKPDDHPALLFDWRFFFMLLISSLPQHRGGLLLGLLLLLSCALPGRVPRQQLLILGQPILFALLFALMTTLSRSSMGIEQATVSRYSSYSILILVGLVLLLIVKFVGLPGLQVLTLVLAFLLAMAPGKAYVWSKELDLVLKRYDERVALTRCALLTSGRQCLRKGLWPNETPYEFMRDYFQGDHSLKGWHRQVIESR